MTVEIEEKICDGCNKVKEPICMKVCPGDLIYKDVKENKAVLRSQSECWSCAACVKICPQEAIKLYYAPELGGRGSFLTASYQGERLIWKLNRLDGKEEKLKLQIKNT